MERIGSYTIQRELGRGGMGAVYLARSLSGRYVAIKVIRPEYAADPRFRERFRQEVEAARKVGGFHTAAVVDADPDAPQPWMASAYIEGPTLQAVIEQSGALPEERLWQLAAALAEALEAIHACGLVHRDLKPANIVLAADGPRVLDFGIARVLDESRLTTDGVVVGTAGYHSPEQALGRPITGASDVFALGAVLVAASGGSAFGHGSAPGLMYRVVHETPDVSAVPPSLRPVVLHCLQKDPAGRPSPRELLSRCAERAGVGGGSGGEGGAGAGDPLTHEATVADEAPTPPPPPPPPPPPTTAPAPPVKPLPLAVYHVRRKVWVLQVLRHAAGVAGLVVGAVLSDRYDLPVAILVAALFLALLLGVRLLGLLGAGKDSLTLSERGIGVGPPNNLVVIPWPEIKSVELKDHSKRGTELTVHRDVVRQLPQGAQHPTWVRDGPAGALRIRTGRLAPLGGERQVSDAVRQYARRHRVKVVQVREG